MSADRAADLRAAFDRGFAEPPEGTRPAHVDLLRIRLGDEPHALALAEISGLHTNLHVVAVPTRSDELLGVVAVRAAIIPIYDLRARFGLPRHDTPRWIVLASQIGFAFEAFDGHLRVPIDQLARGNVVHEGRVHPIVELTAVTREIRERWTKDG